jgi:actin-related protein 8
MGGDDITEFFYVLLTRIKFPYRDIDLNHSYDWNVLEDLKSRLCTLADVGYWMPLLLAVSFLITL